MLLNMASVNTNNESGEMFNAGFAANGVSALRLKGASPLQLTPDRKQRIEKRR